MRRRYIDFSCAMKRIKVHSLALKKDKTGWEFLLTDCTISKLLEGSFSIEDIKTDFDTLQEVILFIERLPTLHRRKV